MNPIMNPIINRVMNPIINRVSVSVELRILLCSASSPEKRKNGGNTGTSTGTAQLSFRFGEMGPTESGG